MIEGVGCLLTRHNVNVKYMGDKIVSSEEAWCVTF
jgi:hypothetical protein